MRSTLIRRLIGAGMVLAALWTLPAARGEPAKPKVQAKPLAVARLDRKTPVDFEHEILPLLNASCLACHNKTKAKAGLVLETPADIRKGGDAGPAVVPAKPGDSLLFQAASHQADTPMPPPGNKAAARDLTGEQLALLKLWIEQGAAGEVRGAAEPAWKPLPPELSPIYAAAITPDGRFAACGRGNSIAVYDLRGDPKSMEAGKPITMLSDPAALAAPAVGKVGSVKAGLAKATPAPGAARGGNAPAPAHRDLVQSLAFSPDGRLLASGGYREVKLWRRPEKPEQAWELVGALGTGGPDSPLSDRVNALAFSPDGGRLATGGGVPSRGGEIDIWNVADRTLAKRLDDIHSDAVAGLAFSPDGKRLASASTDKLVRIVDISSGKILHSLEGHTHHALGVAWKPDGQAIASVGADNTLRFWNPQTGERGKVVQNFDKEATSVTFVGDTGAALVTSGDGKVRLIKESGSDVRSFAGASDYVYCGAASADGAVILAGGQDGVLRIWKSDGKLAASLQR